MGFVNYSTKAVVISENKEHLAVTEKTNDQENTDKILTLSEFFNNDNFAKLEKITVLELTHCQITDLPIAFENLNLKRLNLSRNNLSNVPACIYSGLNYLEYLDLGHNSIQVFDMPPGCLLHIKTIKLNNNLLYMIPKWIVTFQSINLEELNFSFNKASQYTYHRNSYNMHFMKLNKLKLKNSQLIDDDFDFLKCLKNLEYLDISNKGDIFINKFHEVDNLFVKPKWKQLKILKMNNLGLSLFPEGVPWLESLSELHINENCISWFPDGIEFMVNLRVLNISQNSLVAIPDAIIKLELLEVLLASANNIEICPDFSKMVNLKTLDLYDNLLEHVQLNCDTLDSFDLDQNYISKLDFPNYDAKKKKLRDTFTKTEIRIDNQKLRYEDDITDSFKTCSDDDYGKDDVYGKDEDTSSFHTVLVNKTIFDEAEDWDSPDPIGQRHPDIDSEDDSWDGEEKRIVNKKVKVRKKVYVEDEDWMFQDVEDIQS